jgi:hypothetical protein
MHSGANLCDMHRQMLLKEIYQGKGRVGGRCEREE